MTAELSAAVSDGLRAEVREYLRTRPDLGPADLAAHTALAESTVRNFLSGHCNGGREVVGEIRRVLMLARAGDILAPGGGRAVVVAGESVRRAARVRRRGNIYETETVRRIGEVLDYCVAQAAIGVVTADFGAGKTMAVEAWRRKPGRLDANLLFEFDEFTSSNKVEFVQRLAELLGVEVARGSQSGGKVFRAVCERLREEPALLIFDQCELARARIFQVIRQVWDRTREAGVGVVLLAAPVLLTRMLVSRMADLGALTSRVGIWAPLSGVTKNEMAEIVKQEGIAEVDEAALELWWRATGGSMRRLMAAVDLINARHQGKRVTEKTITGVAAHLWGMRIEGAA